MEKHTEITMHPNWSAYFKSPEGQDNILNLIKTLSISRRDFYKLYTDNELLKSNPALFQQNNSCQAKSIALELTVKDPRLGQFIPSDIFEDAGTPCTVKDVITLADLSGLKTDLENDMLFTALAFLSHGVVKVESYYSSGTDQCDLSHTEAFVLKRTSSYETAHLVNDKAWACAVAAKYNLDMEIFYENLCTNGGAGDGTEYSNSFNVTFLGKFEVEDKDLGEIEDQYRGDEDEEN